MQELIAQNTTIVTQAARQLEVAEQLLARLRRERRRADRRKSSSSCIILRLYVPRTKRPVIDYSVEWAGLIWFHDSGFECWPRDHDPAAAIVSHIWGYPVNIHFVTDDDREQFNSYLERGTNAGPRDDGVIKRF